MQTVTCPCGAVELSIEGEPLAQFYCHCDDCRTMTSGAYAAESVHRENQVSVRRGQTTAWTLKRNPRHFCVACGGRLFIEVVAQKLCGVNGLLLPADSFRPKFHVNCDFAVLPVKDGLPHFARMPAMFGGSDDKVEW